MKQIFTTYGPAWIIGSCLIGLTADFLLRFLRRALMLGSGLEEGLSELRKIRNTSPGPVTDLDATIGKAMEDVHLGHLWQEYAKTLHAQREPDELGQQRVHRWRATALAEVFFTDQAVVDSPLATGYYKHLPGIFTGLGIIGTFSGLIRGLRSFSVSADSGAVEESLRRLMNSVGDAFVVSGAAIFLAMLLTLIEKLVISSLYRKLEMLRQAMDALFAAGAQDEYLERIVKASETSATQAVQLKDALVSDLKQILSDITAKQLAASAQHSNMISADVGKAISGTLAPIAQAFETVRANQGEAVSKLLVDVLASFSNQIEEMFGGQMAATQQLLQTTNAAVQSTASRLEQLAGNIDRAGQQAADAMAERLTQAVLGMETRQDTFNRQMTEVVTQLRNTATESQHEAAQKMQQVLTALGKDLESTVGRVQEQVVAVASRQEEQAGKVIGSLSTQVEQLVLEVSKANRAMQSSVSALSASTTDSISQMQDGARTLGGASDDLARTASRAADALRLAGGTVESMREAADALAAASITTGQVSADYARSRDVFAAIISELKVTVESARREASFTSDVLAKLKKGAEPLNHADSQIENYVA